MEQDPLNVTRRAVLGSILNHADMYDRAEEELLAALELDANHSTPNLIISETYWATERFAEAAVAAEKAYNAMPLAFAPLGTVCRGAGARGREGPR